MDPLACWRLVVGEEDPDERAFHALNLLKWLAMGGYVPDIGGRGSHRRVRIVDACETIIIQALEAE